MARLPAYFLHFLATARPLRESAAHRRARKARTRARTVLRTFVSGDTAASRHSILAAVQALAGHHSRSVLVERARRLLRHHLNSMSTPKDKNWCYRCSQLVRRGSSFCNVCGEPVGAGAPTQYQGTDRWQQPWAPAGAWWEPEAPPPAPPKPPPSPRLRSPKGRRGGQRGQGNGPGEGKAAGKGPAAKGKAPEGDFVATDSTRVLVPPTGQLPKAPKVKPIPAPKPSVDAPQASQSTEVSQDRKLLEAMLQHFAGREGELPDAVRGMLASYSTSNTRMETKELHQLVAIRAEAKNALAAISKERQTYESAWQTYLSKLTQQLQQQLQEREDYLVKLNEAEEQWRLKGSAASSSIARAAAEGQLVGSEAEADSMAVEVSADVMEAAKTNREHIKQSSLQVMQALASVNTRIQEVMPERERTPRGRRALTGNLETVESSPEMLNALGAADATSGGKDNSTASPVLSLPTPLGTAPPPGKA